MGFLNNLKNIFAAKEDPVDACASDYPDWSPNSKWSPKFENAGAVVESYHAN